MRPVNRVLSEDCWTIATCISNKSPLPRIIRKNGKRDAQLVSNQSRVKPCKVTSHASSCKTQATYSQSSIEPPDDPITSSGGGYSMMPPHMTNRNDHASNLNSISSSSTSLNPNSAASCDNHDPSIPASVKSHSEVSNRFISREIARFDCDLSDIRRDINRLNRSISLPSDVNCVNSSSELAAIKN